MKPSFIWAGVIAIAVGAWIGSGQLGSGSTPEKVTNPPVASADLPTVRVREYRATTRTQDLVLLGVTEASRKVTIRAETKGRIVAVPVVEGASARRGKSVVRLAVDDRRERLAEAEARLRQYQLEYNAALKLAQKNFRSKVKLAESHTYLVSAKAALAAMNLDLARTNIRAPFDGILESRQVEIGDFVDIGDPLATFIDLSPLLIVGQITEREVGRLELGTTARARLVSGQTFKGRISRIASIATAATRTFRVEVTVDNRAGKIADGLTAEMRIPTPEIRGHRVSPATLSLSENGDVGIKIVDAAGQVAFHKIEIKQDTPEGIWVTGLPERVRVITIGQEYVRAGDRVRTVVDSAAGAPDRAEPKS